MAAEGLSPHWAAGLQRWPTLLLVTPVVGDFRHKGHNWNCRLCVIVQAFLQARIPDGYQRRLSQAAQYRQPQNASGPLTKIHPRLMTGPVQL